MDEQKLKLWQMIKYFKPSEFDDPTLPGSGLDKMNIEFVVTLDHIRAQCGFGFTIDSGYRSPIHNISVGGKPDSAHLKGIAADIICSESDQRFTIVEAGFKWGIRRFGIGDTFVHLDMSLDLPSPRIWLYPKGATATNQKGA